MEEVPCSCGGWGQGTQPKGSISLASSEEEGKGDVLHWHVSLDFETRWHAASPSDLGMGFFSCKTSPHFSKEMAVQCPVGTLLAVV